MVFPCVLVLVSRRDFPSFDRVVHSWEMEVVEVEIYGRPGFAFFDYLEADRAMGILSNARLDFKVFKEADIGHGPHPPPPPSPNTESEESEQRVPPEGEGSAA
jgi:hypothetical protein